MSRVGLLSGWGTEERRNPGDELCHAGLKSLISPTIPAELVDLRTSLSPVTLSPEELSAIVVGGGTVLPTLFMPWVAEKLRESVERIVLLGSGCLSPRELARKRIAVDPAPYRKHAVIGLRGPLSARYFKALTGQSAPVVGDLVFALPRVSSPSWQRRVVRLFVIEGAGGGARAKWSLARVVDLGVELSKLVRASGEVSLVITGTTSSADVRQAVEAGRASNLRVEFSVGSESLRKLVAQSSFVVSERLHPVVVAIMEGVPFIALQTTSKLADLRALLRRNSPRVAEAMFLGSPTDFGRRVAEVARLRHDSGLKEELESLAYGIRDRLSHAGEELNSWLCRMIEDQSVNTK